MIVDVGVLTDVGVDVDADVNANVSLPVDAGRGLKTAREIPM